MKGIGSKHVCYLRRSLEGGGTGEGMWGTTLLSSHFIVVAHRNKINTDAEVESSAHWPHIAQAKTDNKHGDLLALVQHACACRTWQYGRVLGQLAANKRRGSNAPYRKLPVPWQPGVLDDCIWIYKLNCRQCTPSQSYCEILN